MSDSSQSCFDHGRLDLIGLPESILCDSKPLPLLVSLLHELRSTARHPVLLTRLTPDTHDELPADLQEVLDYEAQSHTAYMHGRLEERKGSVAIVSAGTSDEPVALEAERTLNFLGYRTERFRDAGVAGLWRIERVIPALRKVDVVIVIAGMDAALATVVAGSVGMPVIGVPTSVGYGVNSGGHAALNAMLASCAAGLCVTNIDNGFGAACAAARILREKK